MKPGDGDGGGEGGEGVQDHMDRVIAVPCVVQCGQVAVGFWCRPEPRFIGRLLRGSAVPSGCGSERNLPVELLRT
jgi:hypothetical protein